MEEEEGEEEEGEEEEEKEEKCGAQKKTSSSSNSVRTTILSAETRVTLKSQLRRFLHVGLILPASHSFHPVLPVSALALSSAPSFWSHYKLVTQRYRKWVPAPNGGRRWLHSADRYRRWRRRRGGGRNEPHRATCRRSCEALEHRPLPGIKGPPVFTPQFFFMSIFLWRVFKND